MQKRIRISLWWKLICAAVLSAGLASGIYLIEAPAADPPADEDQRAASDRTDTPVGADEALSRLKEGNRRCIGGESSHSHNLENWRERFLRTQRPFATILACSDSRVPPELLFDQGFGDLFVIRIAGNVVGPDVIASIQYAIGHLDNKLIVVTGHQNCGAVTAALSPSEATVDEPAELRGLLDRIRPGIQPIRPAPDAKQAVAAAVEANVRASVKQLSEIPSIAEAIRAKDVKIIGVVYAIDTGEIAIVDD